MDRYEIADKAMSWITQLMDDNGVSWDQLTKTHPIAMSKIDATMAALDDEMDENKYREALRGVARDIQKLVNSIKGARK